MSQDDGRGAARFLHAEGREPGKNGVERGIAAFYGAKLLKRQGGRRIALACFWLKSHWTGAGRGASIRVDGALLDTFHLAHGYWEAKGEKDDLDREIKAKLDKGYPRDNIILQVP